MGNDLPLSPDLPAVLGMDFAGTVEMIGEGVTDFALGDEVYGCAGGLADLQGALAELMPADARLIAHKPKSLSMREAAALPLVGITAFEGLQHAPEASKRRSSKSTVHRRSTIRRNRSQPTSRDIPTERASMLSLIQSAVGT